MKGTLKILLCPGSLSFQCTQDLGGAEFPLDFLGHVRTIPLRKTPPSVRCSLWDSSQRTCSRRPSPSCQGFMLTVWKGKPQGPLPPLPPLLIPPPPPTHCTRLFGAMGHHSSAVVHFPPSSQATTSDMMRNMRRPATCIERLPYPQAKCLHTGMSLYQRDFFISTKDNPPQDRPLVRRFTTNRRRSMANFFIHQRGGGGALRVKVHPSFLYQ